MKRPSIPFRLATAAAALVVAGACSHTPAQLRETAESALARGDTSRAIRAYQTWLNTDESDPEPFLRAGELLRQGNTIRDRRLSQDVLEAGLAKHPDDPDLLLQLGITYYRQTFYGDAVRCFDRVLEFDEGNCDAHYYLGLNAFRKWKHVQSYRDYLDEVRSHMAVVLDCAPERQQACFTLALATHVQGDSAACAEVAKLYGRRHRDRPEPYFLLGALAFDAGDYQQADEMFMQAMLRLNEDERQEYEDIRHLLPDEEAEEYELSSDERRDEMRRAFWAQHDPDLTTPENERHVEHIYRMFIADARYSHDRPALRGWDTERGKALIKFGLPAAIGTTLGGGFTSGRMEAWTYENGVTFFFRDEFLNGNYTVPMEPRYSYMAQMIYLDPAVTSIVSTVVPIPGSIETIAFKGGPVSSDVYVAYEVSVDSLDLFLDLDEVNRFVARSAVYDGAWAAEGYFADTLTTEEFMGRVRDGRHESVTRYELPFADLHFAVCLEDNLGLTRTQLSAASSTLRFLGSKLGLSDILLYDRTVDTSQDIVHRGQRDFAPRLGARYEPGEKLSLYIEIYNLGVKGDRCEYDVTYSIYPTRDDSGVLARLAGALKRVAGFVTSPEPVISQTLMRTGVHHDEYEDLSIDIDSLEPGRYALEVNVRDKIQKEESQIVRIFTKLAAATD